MKSKAFLYRVNTSGGKIQLISSKAAESFRKEKRLLICVPTLEAAQYVESLLWRFPEESFMPHHISDCRSKEWIVITLQNKENVNQAPCLLNLGPTPSPMHHLFEEIYDLYDESSPQKQELSEKKKQYYLEQDLEVIVQ